MPQTSIAAVNAEEFRENLRVGERKREAEKLREN